MHLSSIPSLWQPSVDGSRDTLMVILHGRGDSPAGFASFQEELGIPSLNCLLLQAPDDYYGGYSWYAIPPNQKPGILRSRSLLEKAFAEIETLGFRADQIILFGFSQGCLMTLDFGTRYPKLLKGYIGSSGYCYNTQDLLIEAYPHVISHQGRWLITHGTEDEILDVETTRSQMQELISNGFQMDYREYDKTHTVSEEEIDDIRDWILMLL